jgi:hypothetical protein
LKFRSDFWKIDKLCGDHKRNQSRNAKLILISLQDGSFFIIFLYSSFILILFWSRTPKCPLYSSLYLMKLKTWPSLFRSKKLFFRCALKYFSTSTCGINDFIPHQVVRWKKFLRRTKQVNPVHYLFIYFWEKEKIGNKFATWHPSRHTHAQLILWIMPSM